jgi:molybdate transport system regulatory protein
MSKQNVTDVDFRIWFFTEGEKLLGKGRVELLSRIDETGSIYKAAKEMKMSYRQAWQMVQEMNERASNPLVEKKLGGKGGGGAFITDAGKKAISAFQEFHNKVKTFINKESKDLII